MSKELDDYDEELAQLKPQIVPPRTYRRTGELKLDTAMQDNLARCRADRGGEFHPVTIS